MKGQEPLMATTIVLVLAIGIAAFGSSVLSQSLDSGVENNLRLQAQKIASVINIIQKAPTKTTTTISLPRTPCVIEITPTFVKIKTVSGTKENSYEANIIRSTTTIMPATFSCLKDKQIEIAKTDENIILVRAV